MAMFHSKWRPVIYIYIYIHMYIQWYPQFWFFLYQFLIESMDLNFLPYGPPYIIYPSVTLLGANLEPILFMSVSKRRLAKKRGTNLSTFRILLLWFNETDFIKRFTTLKAWETEHFMNMHLTKNCLLQHAYLEYWILIIVCVCVCVCVGGGGGGGGGGVS